MKIGILLCGTFPDVVREARGEYDGFFRALLLKADPTLEFLTVNVEAGDTLPPAEAADAWVITGSRHGVYEPHGWMEPLKAMVREIVGKGIPLAGICFGHQVMAEALGGRAMKSEKGWGLGVDAYEPVTCPGWMPEDLRHPWEAVTMHKDQVVELPPGTTVLAANEFCPYAALAYGDPEAPDAISVQPHPEYTADLFAHMLVERVSKSAPPEVIARAQATLHKPHHGEAWGTALVRFFRQRAGR